MRPILAMVLPVLLAACQLALPGTGADTPNPVTGGDIAVTTLDAPVEGLAEAEVADPDATVADAEAVSADTDGEPDALQPLTETTATPEVAPQPPEPEEIDPALQTPEALACVRRGGRYLAVGGGTITRSCVTPTRDGGDRCERGAQCDGECLARSGTCAPVTPLFGCNEILQDDGRRVTLCID